jgi:CheY-like chemotaxis protein
VLICAHGRIRGGSALLDIGLPAMDGYELAKRLRSATRDRPLRLVAGTDYGQESDRLRAVQAGFDAHVVKPVEIQLVAELLERFRLDEERGSGG